MTWVEQDHPRNRQGEFAEKWAHALSRRVAGSSLFDSFVDPELGDPGDDAIEQATSWAHNQMDYYDEESDSHSQVDEVEHHGDGIVVRGSFMADGQDAGQYEFSIGDLDGRRAIAVETISVDQPYRGRGIARAWVRRLEEAGRAEGVEMVSMWDQSGGFWESQGYTKGRLDIAEKLL